MSAEADALCGADYDERVNSRNRYRPPQFDSRVGSLNLAVPKLRTGSYFRSHGCRLASNPPNSGRRT